MLVGYDAIYRSLDVGVVHVGDGVEQLVHLHLVVGLHRDGIALDGIVVGVAGYDGRLHAVVILRLAGCRHAVGVVDVQVHHCASLALGIRGEDIGGFA